MTILPDDELKAVREALEAGAEAMSRQAATNRKYEAEFAKEFDGLAAEIAAGLCAQDAEKHAATLRALLRHIDALTAKLSEWASECAECDGTGVYHSPVGFTESEPCPACADIRALLPTPLPGEGE